MDDLSFTVQEGEFYTLLGPSGCGKTTTLKCVAGLERADGGRISLGDTVVVSDQVFVPTHRRDIGMVFQNYAVWPHMNVYDNVAFPLQVGARRESKTSQRDKVMNALELVDLGGLEKRMSTELSGGQQQRLSLARALVREPRVLLLDEPLSNLDAKLRESMRTELSLIQRRLGITALFVTHDQSEALAMSDRIAVMRDGSIVQEGTPREIYHEPADEFVASFVGSTNLFHGEVGASAGEGHVLVETPFGRVACATDPRVDLAGPVAVTVRPEDVVIHEERPADAHEGRMNTFHGVLEIGQFTGASVQYRVTLASGEHLTALSGSREDLPSGARVVVELPVDACRVIRRARPAADSSDERDASPAGVVA
ncbi:ABC transporter ATP-binding protein [Actinotalea sp. Marseille-Q4924]|uniref:ABC transporter ATP-binding protein n=1 Tax=Actinotalea sp. Marseille-Q4924 TaxID=2866571 RepID=UPI001CE3BBC1|nr:ABC transporter ATP-binding protein [Actinotalea sp. Marseille-Q4924]